MGAGQQGWWSVITAFLELLKHPLVRAALGATLICWLFALLLLVTGNA